MISTVLTISCGEVFRAEAFIRVVLIIRHTSSSVLTGRGRTRRLQRENKCFYGCYLKKMFVDQFLRLSCTRLTYDLFDRRLPVFLF